MMTNAELKTELARACKARDEAVREAIGMFGGPLSIEQRIALTGDDCRMAMFFIARLIERLPHDSATDRETQGHE